MTTLTRKLRAVAQATSAKRETSEPALKHRADNDERTRCILEHENLVRYLAGKFANRGIPLEDLVQVGMIGLINAVDRFDRDRGIKFSTYATPTIVGEIRRYFRDKGWSMKVPRRLQELNMAASKAAHTLAAKSGHPPSVQEIAEHIGATEDDTLAAMELANAYDTVSLDAPLTSDGDAGPLSIAEFVGEEDGAIAHVYEYGDLTEAMMRLQPRERAVIYYRFFQDFSQTQVAKRLNISQMHVSRIQQKALKLLKCIMESIEADEEC